MLLQQIRNMMEKSNIQPEGFKDRTIFMSMSNDIDWGRQGNEENCLQNSVSVAAYAARFPKGHWSFLGPGSEENGLLHSLTNWTVRGTESLKK